ncbi:MAG TPA: serine hydrolase domain-containing protein [Caulobacteraceae bacterium]|nr:serine hydrolase domain-containing protein [Caulobacteraceae bacterium]
MSVEFHGFCDGRFAPLKDAFGANFEEDLELGASLCVTLHGETVVDLWAGWADVAQTRPWEKDTIVAVASTTKIAVTLSLLMLIDRGRIDLDAPIGAYWPQFAQGGKARVTVRDLFTHQAGAPGFTPGVDASILLDWEAATTRIATERHWFDGERRVMYHGITYGLIGGELIRRVDGRMPARFFREEVADRIGLAFYLGMAEVPRPALVAEVTPLAQPGAPPEGLVARYVGSFLGVSGFHPSPWTTLNPSINGVVNARAIAGLCAIFAGGGAFGGTRYLSSSLVDEAWRRQGGGKCPLLGWLPMGLGFGLNGPDFQYPSDDGYGWGGAGGSIGWMDTRLGYSLGYAPNNRFGGSRLDKRVARLNEGVRRALSELGS